MADASWVMPLAVVGGGVVVGSALLFATRKRPSGDARASLEAKKAGLIDELRALAPDDPRRGEVEREAAETLRALDRMPAGVAAAPGGERRAVIGPQLLGAIQGGALVAVLFLVYLSLRDNTTPRADGAPMTGGSAAPMGQTGQMGAMAPMGAPGNAAGGVPAMGDPMAERQAPSLAPAPSARLDAARAALDASPESHDAKVALGWALADGRGWIELYRLVEAMVDADDNDLDALALAAPVQIAMGQRDPAVELLERVLASDPEHTEALVWRGRVAELDGDANAAADYWKRARATARGADVDRMLAAIHAAPAPRGHGASPPGGVSGAMPAGHPGPSTAEAPATDATLNGIVSLADGVIAPPGAVLFFVVRAAGVTTGPPLATRKIVAPTFPRAFTIGPEDVMLQGMQLTGDVTVEARLDVDGDARSKSPDDLRAALPGPVAVGTRGIALVLAR